MGSGCSSSACFSPALPHEVSEHNDDAAVDPHGTSEAFDDLSSQETLHDLHVTSESSSSNNSCTPHSQVTAVPPLIDEASHPPPSPSSLPPKATTLEPPPHGNPLFLGSTSQPPADDDAAAPSSPPPPPLNNIGRSSPTRSYSLHSGDVTSLHEVSGCWRSRSFSEGGALDAVSLDMDVPLQCSAGNDDAAAVTGQTNSGRAHVFTAVQDHEGEPEAKPPLLLSYTNPLPTNTVVATNEEGSGSLHVATGVFPPEDLDDYIEDSPLGVATNRYKGAKGGSPMSPKDTSSVASGLRSIYMLAKQAEPPQASPLAGLCDDDEVLSGFGQSILSGDGGGGSGGENYDQLFSTTFNISTGEAAEFVNRSTTGRHHHRSASSSCDDVSEEFEDPLHPPAVAATSPSTTLTDTTTSPSTGTTTVVTTMQLVDLGQGRYATTTKTTRW